MGVSQMSGVFGVLPYQAYQHGAAARIRSVYGNMYGRPGQDTSGTAAAGTQAGSKDGAALSSAGTQAVQNAGQASSVSGIQRSGVVTASRGASPGTPVEPVSPVNAVGSGTAKSPAIPFLRQGMDPAELAVRMRIQYMDPAQGDRTAAVNLPGMAAQNGTGQAPGAVSQDAALPGARQAPGVQETVNERECQTCKQRKYQDGSDDAGVSYQTPTHIDPDQAAAAVRGHEMEHVVRERASAEREDRRVVSQSVTMHTAICPECGKVYVSGGTTRTTTASDPKPEMPAERPEDGFSRAT